MIHAEYATFISNQGESISHHSIHVAHSQRALELHAAAGDPYGFLTGRWCSLFVRGVRQGCFHYDEWKGNQRRETKRAPDTGRPGKGYAVDDVRRLSMIQSRWRDQDGSSWMGEAPDIPEMDYDEMYNSTIKAAANDPTIHG